MAKEHPTPWQVYSGKLRPEFSAKIVEILDADGKTVIPWQGFDPIYTQAKRIRIAKRIVRAVNRSEDVHV